MIPPVRAAGGVVWREHRGEIEILLVHRPQYDDWTIPKGKADSADETDEACALREVEEETGLACRLGHELAAVQYLDRVGRTKVVRYWAMTSDGEAEARNEIDEVRWLPTAQARQLLSYDRDRVVLDSFRAGLKRSA